MELTTRRSVHFDEGIEVCLKSDVDAVLAEKDAEIAELKAKSERLIEFKDKYSRCAEKAIDTIARLELKIRRLSRALWLARAELCRRLDVDRYLRKHINSWYNENCLTWAEACVAMEVKMCKAESKCRAMAEKFGG